MTVPDNVHDLSVGTPPAAFLDDWRHLEATSHHPSFFRTPEWIMSWWETIGERVPTSILSWRDGGSLAAISATSRVRHRLHRSVSIGALVVSPTGAGPGGADHTGFTMRPSAHHLLSEWMASSRTSLLLPNLDPAFESLLPNGAVQIGLTSCPRMSLADSHTESKHMKKVAYYRRRLAKESITLERVPPGKVAPEHLESLFDLHYRRREGDTSFTVDRAQLHERLIQRQSGEVGPTVVIARAEGRTVGVLWGLWFAGVFSYFQTGWDPSLAKLNVGTVLVDEAIEFARDLGAETFDFLRGAESYKYRFGATDRVDGSWLIPRGPGGSLLVLRHRLRQSLVRSTSAP